MNIDSIKNGYVIDHIQAGKAMRIYDILGLENKSSGNIKIDKDIPIDFETLGFIDHNITVNVVKDDIIIEKRKLSLPQRVVNVARCTNPRCITSIEKDLDQVFNLTDKENEVYRCLYCESSLKNKE